MEYFKLCEAKSGYVWNIIIYTGKDTNLKNFIEGVDLKYFTKPTKILINLSEKLLNKGYLIGLNNYYSGPEFFIYSLL